jgi:uncharacterized protein YjbI with pentapeptide repeats
MSEIDSTESSTKQRTNRKTTTANQQNGKQTLAVQRPLNDDTEKWKAYWNTQGQPWRTEPEIDVARQKYLDEQRSIKPEIVNGIYPFKDIKLTRADVEWLLATHENGRGPVDWSNEKTLHERKGLDLRGADLQHLNLNGLPLTHLYGGLDQAERDLATEEQIEMAGVYLEGASLKRARLERAVLSNAHLENADLFRAHLVRANLYGAHLERTNLRQAHLEGAYLLKSTLSDENGIGPQLLRVRWGNADLAVVKWSQMKMLAEDYAAKQKKHNGKAIERTTRLERYEQAVRANRQLAVALQGQGLNEDAARFNYHAQLLQRKVFWYQNKFGQYLFSLFLDLLAGYGYKPGRSFIAYAVVISFFATIYFLLGSHLAWNEAIVISMTAFHGRGFFPNQFHPGDLQALVAAIEAFVGLLIEVTFIATLTQRLFGK